MRIAFSCALLALAGGATLATDYSKERSLKVESEVSLAMETTEMSVERDGTPQDNAGRGGMKSERSWHVTQVDETLAHDGKKPTKVKRSYEKVGGASSFTMGENEPRENTIDSPFEGATLQISGEGEDVKVEFLEGKKPDHEGALAGQRMELALDALLPEKDVEKDAHWDLDAAQISRALGFNLHKGLYPPPPPPDNAGGGAGGGGGRRGGGMGRGMGGLPLPEAEWTGKAKLVSLDEDVDGVKCAKVEIEIRAKGDLPEPQGGGGRRQRMFEPESMSPAFANSYSIEAKGEFYFAIEGKRPVKLELEGTAETVMDREMKRDESTTKIHSKQAGKLKVKITVSEEAKEAKAPKGK